MYYLISCLIFTRSSSICQCVSSRGHELKSISLFWPLVRIYSETENRSLMDAILCTMVKVMLVVSKLTGVLQISILGFGQRRNKMRIGCTTDSELSCLWRFIKSEQGWLIKTPCISFTLISHTPCSSTYNLYREKGRQKL